MSESSEPELLDNNDNGIPETAERISSILMNEVLNIRSIMSPSDRSSTAASPTSNTSLASRQFAQESQQRVPKDSRPVQNMAPGAQIQPIVSVPFDSSGASSALAARFAPDELKLASTRLEIRQPVTHRWRTEPALETIRADDGSRTVVSRADGFRVRFDWQGHATETTDARGATVSLRYNTRGDVTRISDERGTYERVGQTNSWRNVKSPNSYWTGEVTVDADGNRTERCSSGLVQLFNRNGARTWTQNGVSVSTDVLNRVTAINRSDGTRTRLTYEDVNHMGDEGGVPLSMTLNDVEWTRRPGTRDWYRGAIREGNPDWRGRVTVESSGVVREEDGARIRHYLPEGGFRLTAPQIDWKADLTRELADHALTIFDQLDSSGNGFVTRRELGTALGDPRFTGRSAQAIAAMWTCFSQLKCLSTDERGWESDISRADLQELRRISESDEKVVADFARAASRTQQAQQTAGGARFELYNGAVSADAINQGDIKNCYFMAALSSVAQSNPENIRQMIRDNLNGTYTVTFPGASRSVTVTRPTDAEMGVYGRSNNGSGMWPLVLEKAYSAYHGSSRNHTVYEGSEGGGFSNSGLDMLTGRSSTGYFVGRESARQAIIDALSERRPVVAQTGTNLRGLRRDHTSGGFHRQHLYSVLSFNQDTNTVVVRNPWGNGDGPGGTVQLTWDEFERNFYRARVADR